MLVQLCLVRVVRMGDFHIHSRSRHDFSLTTWPPRMMIRQRAAQADYPLLTAIIITVVILPPVRVALYDARPWGGFQDRQGVPLLIRTSITAIAVAGGGFLAEVGEEWSQRGDASQRDLEWYC